MTAVTPEEVSRKTSGGRNAVPQDGEAGASRRRVCGVFAALPGGLGGPQLPYLLRATSTAPRLSVSWWTIRTCSSGQRWLWGGRA